MLSALLIPGRWKVEEGLKILFVVVVVVVLKGVLVLQACPSKTCAKLQFQSSRALHLLIARGRRAARGQ